jgi:Holliday junction resolvasome RuvABC endonuclease subunit
MRGEILTLDLASQTGWCRGEFGGKLIYGSQKLAPEGATNAEKCAGMIKWLNTQLTSFKPRLIVMEAPMAPSQMAGKTTISTARIALGLPFVVEGVAYLLGCYEVREANVQDVRQVFIGRRTVPNGGAKDAVVARCRELGHEPPDDNAADAIAIHYFAASIYGGR